MADRTLAKEISRLEFCPALGTPESSGDFLDFQHRSLGNCFGDQGFKSELQRIRNNPAQDPDSKPDFMHLQGAGFRSPIQRQA